MKKNLLFVVAVALFTLFTASCAKELQVDPTSGTYTKEQLANAFKASLINKQAVNNSIYGPLTTVSAFLRGDNEFGLPSLLIKLDCLGDVYVTYPASGWFGTDYTDCSPTSYRLIWPLWRGTYAYIANTNNLISANPESDVLAQALGLRAYFYHILIRAYAFNYRDHKKDLGVVWVDENTVQPGARLSVEQIYDKIWTDITNSEKAFKDAGGQVGEASSTFTLGALYHLKAQVALDMEKYDEAIKAADLLTSTTSRYKPYEVEDCDIPAFWNFQDDNMVWCLTYDANVPVAKSPLRSWIGWQCPLMTVGYAKDGFMPRINSNVHDRIPASDVRSTWFTSADPVTGKTVSPSLTKWASSNTEAAALLSNWLSAMPANVSVKFAPSDGSPSAQLATACTPLMRIEEMFYVKAEAQVRKGDKAGAQATLNGFVKANRNPSFDATLFTTSDDLLKEIYFQRQIEFYGEGKNFFDLKRFGYDLIRSKSKTQMGTSDWGGYQTDSQFNISSKYPILNMYIPLNETDVNRACKQNTVAPIPTTGQFNQ